MRSIATTLPIRSLILCAAILAAITVPAHSQPLYEDSARVSHRPLRREPPPAYEVTEEFVTLSEPSEPLQFQIVEEQVPQGEMIYGTDVPGQYGQPWSWQLLPEGLIYRSYLAGEREPRLAGVYAYDDRTDSWLIDATVGARVGLIRYGTETDIRPDGWELDIEGAAFPRLLPEEEMDMAATDFRIGIPLTYGYGPLRFKLAVYHLSAHLGDEYMLKNPDFPRINYVRDVAVFGTSYYATEDLRLYGEAGWAFHNDGGSKPWEFQFGIEYSPLRIPQTRRWSPFVAANGHLREELNYSGTFVFQTGIQFRGRYTERLLRMGVQYLTGPSPQQEFYAFTEEQIGAGIWYDF